MRDLYSNLTVEKTLNPAAQTATVSGTGVDLQGYDSAMAVIHTGALVGSALFTAKLREADTYDGTYSDVADTDLSGSFPASFTANTIYKVGYRGTKRFIRVACVYTSGTSLVIGAVIVKGHPNRAPTA